jgi:hypothetical protein
MGSRFQAITQLSSHLRWVAMIRAQSVRARSVEFLNPVNQKPSGGGSAETNGSRVQGCWGAKGSIGEGEGGKTSTFLRSQTGFLLADVKS